MRHITYSDSGRYHTAILIKDASFIRPALESSYVQPLESRGLTRDDMVLCSLPYNDKGKAPVSFIKEQLEVLLLGLHDVGVQQIYCADAAYFKVLTKTATKADAHFGYVLPCKIEGFEHFSVVLGVNHKSLIYNPNNEGKLVQSIDTLVAHVQGSYQALGADIIHNGYYPSGYLDIKAALEGLYKYPELTCDIEAFSLDFDKAGLGTIGFSWNKHEGIAFCCDYQPLPVPVEGNYGEYIPNPRVQALIREFFETYQGKLIFHNSTYDIKVMIYVLWMETLLDTNGLLKGLEFLTRDFEDTKIIAYLALNSTARNALGLKDLAQPFAGNYAEDVKDIRKVPREKLLRYNLVDCLSTYYVCETYYPAMCTDDQLELYRNLMLPSQRVITQMELTGMPLDPSQIEATEFNLQTIVAKHQAVLDKSPTIKAFTKRLQHEAMVAKNATLKKKQHPIEHFADVVFNPGSPKQLQALLYEVMELPVIDYTKTKQPATGAETLTKLLNLTDNPEYLAIIEALMGRSGAQKVLSTFIPAFKNAVEKGTDVVWLHGNFNMGGTVSGRMSSSDPNLQNIPSGSEYGKAVKQCFRAPKGWIFGGADFNSLEDYISALTTKDPNKLRVYTDGYDGHCLRAHSYFGNQMPDIQQADPGETCYQVDTSDGPVYVKATDVLVLPDGTKQTAEAVFIS